MAKSIRRVILENIETTIGGISQASGYLTNFKPKQISRSPTGLGRENSWPTVLIGASDVPVNSLCGDEVDRQLTVSLTVTLGGAVQVLPAQVEDAIADIIKAMAVDPTRGGYACQTNEPEIREPSFSQVLEDHGFVSLVYTIEYRHRRTDPALP